MGLDMYIYSVRKPDIDTNKVYKRSELNNMGIIIREDEITLPMYKQLAPYSVMVRAITEYYDLEKMGKDYGLTDVKLNEISSDYIGICGYNKKNKEESIRIPNDIVNNEYIYEQEENFYACEDDDVWYWRKRYDIQGWFHNYFSETVENIGYYVITEQMIKDFKKAFPDINIPWWEPDEECACVYHEWY